MAATKAKKKDSKKKGAADDEAVPVPYVWETMRFDDLDPHPDQQAVRQITDEALSGLTNFIGKVGLIEEPVYNKRTGRIVSGHQRLKSLKALGHTEGKIKVIDVDETEEKVIFVGLNNQAISGEFTPETKVYLQEMKVELGEPLFVDIGLGALEVSLPDVPTEPKEGETDPDDTPEPPKVAKSKLGELYQLGDHRLLCGDATKKEDVERLMGGVKADMVFTDPPYGD